MEGAYLSALPPSLPCSSLRASLLLADVYGMGWRGRDLRKGGYAPGAWRWAWQAVTRQRERTPLGLACGVSLYTTSLAATCPEAQR